jgi:hypothetical protein
MKNYPSYEMELHQIFFFLFVRGLTTVFLVGELGFEGQRHGLCEVPILLHVTFCGVGPKRKPADED